MGRNVTERLAQNYADIGDAIRELSEETVEFFSEINVRYGEAWRYSGAPPSEPQASVLKISESLRAVPFGEAVAMVEQSLRREFGLTRLLGLQGVGRDGVLKPRRLSSYCPI